MANAFNGMVLENIAQKGFAAFRLRLIQLGIFTTDFSNEVKVEGDKVTTRIVPISAAALDLQGDHSGSRFAAAGDTSTTKVTVTLNQQPITGFHLTDEEAHSIGRGVWSDTAEKLVVRKLNSVANNILNFVYNLITAANFSKVAFTGAASTFDHDDVVDIDTALTDDNFPMGESEVGMVLKAAYFGSLKKDGAIRDFSASDMKTVKEGDSAMLTVDNFTLHKASSLPPAGGTPASENLVGFVTTDEAIAIAMRAVMPQNPGDLEHVQVLTDDQTGATIVYRVAYDRDKGRMNHTFEALYGASLGRGDALQRMVSA